MAPTRDNSASAQVSTTIHHVHAEVRVRKNMTARKVTKKNSSNILIRTLQSTAAIYGLEVTNVIRLWTSLGFGKVVEDDGASSSVEPKSDVGGVMVPPSSDTRNIEATLHHSHKNDVATLQTVVQAQAESQPPPNDDTDLEVIELHTTSHLEQQQCDATLNDEVELAVVHCDDLPDLELQERGSAPSRGHNESYNGGQKDGLFDGGRGRVPAGLSRRAAGDDGGDEDEEMGDSAGGSGGGGGGGGDEGGGGDDGDDANDGENPSEEWPKMSDSAERRRISNRIAQRNYRKKLKQRLRELELRGGLSCESPPQGCAESGDMHEMNGDLKLEQDEAHAQYFQWQEQEGPPKPHPFQGYLEQMVLLKPLNKITWMAKQGQNYQLDERPDDGSDYEMENGWEREETQKSAVARETDSSHHFQYEHEDELTANPWVE